MTTVEHAQSPVIGSWLSCAQAAAMLGLTPSRVAQLRRESRLRAERTALGWLYDPADIQRFAKQRAKENHDREQ